MLYESLDPNSSRYLRLTKIL
uniref:Uncharacterized protein n=1 Tax=Anguilla anguilla TaxID=7936 RepID=A0A0E9Q635_ANGAN